MVRISRVVLLIMAAGSSVLAAADTSRNPDVSVLSEVRDWSAIDTDRDGYVSPDEMEVYLKHAREHRTADRDTGSVRVIEVRNWSAADSDKDGYISADEMEAYLIQARERARANTASEEEKKKSQ